MDVRSCMWRACVHACVRACERACVWACVCVFLLYTIAILLQMCGHCLGYQWDEYRIPGDSNINKSCFQQTLVACTLTLDYIKLWLSEQLNPTTFTRTLHPVPNNTLVTSTVHNWWVKPTLCTRVFGNKFVREEKQYWWVELLPTAKAEKSLINSKGSDNHNKAKKEKRKHFNMPTSCCQQFLLFIVIVL